MTEEVVVERVVDAKQQLWFSKEGERVNVGFTDSFLDVVREAWHVMPTTTGAVKEKSPLLSIETNDGLFSVPSPASGSIISFNDRARDFPDKLTENDVICVIGKPKTAAKKPTVEQMGLDMQNPAADLWNQIQAQAITGARTGRWEIPPQAFAVPQGTQPPRAVTARQRVMENAMREFRAEAWPAQVEQDFEGREEN